MEELIATGQGSNPGHFSILKVFIRMQLIVEYLFFAGNLVLVVFYSEFTDRHKLNSFLFVNIRGKTRLPTTKNSTRNCTSTTLFLGFKNFKGSIPGPPQGSNRGVPLR